MEIHSKLKCDILVSVVEREEDIVIPNGEFIIREEDTISIIAPHKKAIEFLEKIGMIKNPVKSTMLDERKNYHEGKPSFLWWSN